MYPGLSQGPQYMPYLASSQWCQNSANAAVHPQPQYVPPYSNFGMYNRRQIHQKPFYKHQNRIRNYDLWCETCDRDFRTQTALDEHKSEHQKCGIDGCTFIGHALIVTKHIQMQHSSGLYEKIRKLDSPEEIKKWRMERRKRYPTKENIELRRKAQEERAKRGERIEDPKNRFGRRQDKRNGNFQNRRNQRDQNKYGDRHRKQFKQQNDGSGKQCTMIMQVDKVYSTSDNKELKNQSVEDSNKTENLKAVNKSLMENNPLASMVGMYGSDDESEIEEIIKDSEETDILKSDTISEESVLIESKDCSLNLKIEVVKENTEKNEASALSNQAINSTDSKPTRKRVRNRKNRQQLNTNEDGKNTEIENAPIEEKRPKRKSGLNYELLRRRPPNTMLSKLLQKDIRHERNVLLQCVRFVVENKFFGIGQKCNQLYKE